MPPMLVLVATALVALGIGLGAGWNLASRKRSKRDVIMDLENRLERALESRADYEAEVAEHFSQTADLLNKLTSDYRAVYNHLASGADKLCDGEVTIPPAALSQARDEAEVPAHMADVMQPLDYAPRKTADEQGQLSETFGLEKPPEPAFTATEADRAS